MSTGVDVYSTTPGSNGTIGGTGYFPENQAPSTVNDAARQVMADIAAWFGQAKSSSYLTGTAGTNTVTATGPASMAAYAAGQFFTIVPANTNTGATTLNITPSGGAALGAKNVFFNGAACGGGELVQNVPVAVVYDGTQFSILAGFNKVMTIQSFTSTNTWTKPAGCIGVLVKVQAPGGGGGGADSDGVGAGSAGGGGAGGYSEKIIISGLGATETVTIGAVGTAGSATNGTTGGTGGTTSFGAHATATGGGGGSGTGVTTITTALTFGGGTGGTGSSGTVNTTGGAGQIGLSSGGLLISGNGGDAMLGGGAVGRHITAGTLLGGNNGSNYGGGGSGGLIQANTTGAAGGTGGGGIVLVYEFY